MPYVDRPREAPSDPRSLEAYALAYKEQLHARGYATQSVEYKYASLPWFIDWCHERGIERIEQITRPILQRYQRHLYYAISRQEVINLTGPDVNAGAGVLAIHKLKEVHTATHPAKARQSGPDGAEEQEGRS